MAAWVEVDSPRVSGPCLVHATKPRAKELNKIPARRQMVGQTACHQDTLRSGFPTVSGRKIPNFLILYASSVRFTQSGGSSRSSDSKQLLCCKASAIISRSTSFNSGMLA
jgi:hypothetical protein